MKPIEISNMPYPLIPATLQDIETLLQQKASDKKIYQHLESNPALYNLDDTLADTNDHLLHLLAYFKREHLALVLLNGLNCIPLEKIDATNNQKETALYTSIIAGLPKLAQTLLDKGAKPTAVVLSAFLHLNYQSCHVKTVIQLFEIFSAHWHSFPKFKSLIDLIRSKNPLLANRLTHLFDKTNLLQAEETPSGDEDIEGSLDLVLQKALDTLEKGNSPATIAQAYCLVSQALQIRSQEKNDQLNESSSRHSIKVGLFFSKVEPFRKEVQHPKGAGISFG